MTPDKRHSRQLAPYCRLPSLYVRYLPPKLKLNGGDPGKSTANCHGFRTHLLCISSTRWDSRRSACLRGNLR
jgi:hypothetical protein